MHEAARIVCVSGMVGNQHSIRKVIPIDAIPTAVGLTCYTGDAKEFIETPLRDLVNQIGAGTLHVPMVTTYPFDDIVTAHEAMDRKIVTGKIVVLVS